MQWGWAMSGGSRTWPLRMGEVGWLFPVSLPAVPYVDELGAAPVPRWGETRGERRLGSGSRVRARSIRSSANPHCAFRLVGFSVIIIPIEKLVVSREVTTRFRSHFPFKKKKKKKANETHTKNKKMPSRRVKGMKSEQ